jgi:DNA invertase Pin-like site-specific DNA recombinase
MTSVTRVTRSKAATPSALALLGYARVTLGEGRDRAPLDSVATAIGEACTQRGWYLAEVVHDSVRPGGRCSGRPGLGYALEQLACGRADGLVVAELHHLAGSLGDMAPVLTWFAASGRVLVAIDVGLDSSAPGGALTMRALASVGERERRRMGPCAEDAPARASTRRASPRPAVRDDPQLRDRIVRMRAAGMTLQAIADTLNAERVPTIRGGREWRPSSVQSAVGYLRPAGRSRPLLPALPVRFG